VVKKLSSFTDEEGSEILIMPNDHCVTTMVDFGTKILGTQNATKGIYEFKKEISESEHLVFYMN
jgi:UDP-3-O-[3-hydroxymyristoyl] N-acetylglucosamine deacetylase/3-hydroxyacyl-[acyl-carrier-protein] dehydratase